MRNSLVRQLQGTNNAQLMSCPFCNQTVMATAAACPYCRRELTIDGREFVYSEQPVYQHPRQLTRGRIISYLLIILIIFALYGIVAIAVKDANRLYPLIVIAQHALL
jgi:hypothetical protein